MHYELSKEFRFEAAHSLPHLEEGHKCRNVHGHSYLVRLHFRANELDDRGFAGLDYAEVSAAVQPLIDALDHAYLVSDDDPYAQAIQDAGGKTIHIGPYTTVEHLARFVAANLHRDLLSLCRVDLHETAKSCVTLVL